MGIALKVVADIGELASIEEGDVEESGVVRKTVDSEIDGVLYCDEYSGYIGCSAKVNSDNNFLGECSKCGMLMKLSKCMTARVTVTEQDGKVHTFTMFQCYCQYC